MDDGESVWVGLCSLSVSMLNTGVHGSHRVVTFREDSTWVRLDYGSHTHAHTRTHVRDVQVDSKSVKSLTRWNFSVGELLRCFEKRLTSVANMWKYIVRTTDHGM